MEIRKAKDEDLEQIINLYEELYDAEKIFDSNLSDKYQITDKQKMKIKKIIHSRKEVFLVAEEDNKIIGLIDGYVIDNIHHIEKVGYLDHLCVDINYRRRRVGTELMEKFFSKMKRKKVSYVKLNAFKENKPAFSLYDKFGFEEYSVFYEKKL